MKLPTEHTCTLYVHWFHDIKNFWVSDIEHTGEGVVLLCTKEVTFDIPPVDPTGQLVDQLEGKKREVQADAQAKINQIDEKIQSLLALPAPTSADELF